MSFNFEELIFSILYLYIKKCQSLFFSYFFNTRYVQIEKIIIIEKITHKKYKFSVVDIF